MIMWCCDQSSVQTERMQGKLLALRMAGCVQACKVGSVVLYAVAYD